jgi:hypothetical protein
VCPECPNHRVVDGEILEDNAGLGKMAGRLVVLCVEPSVMRKQVLRDVEQIHRR